MDLIYNYDENQEEILERQRRRERMKEEKRLQELKRARARKMIPIAAGGAVAFVAVIVLLVWGIRALVNAGKEKTLAEADVVVEGYELPEQEVTAEPETVEILPDVKNMLPTTIENPTVTEGYMVDASDARKDISEEDVQSQYACVINATTGKVLATKNGGDRMNPASMTKVMTVLVASEHITDLEELFAITIEDTDFAYKNDLSCAGFTVDEQVPVKDLLYGAIMPSGGECCHALERLVADSEEDFIQMMNDKVKELGLTGTHFTNSAGIYNDDHYTTLYDMSMIMKAALENAICREILHMHRYTTTPTAEHPEGIDLSNLFLRRIEDKYTKTEVLGAKTGYVHQSGNCAVSYTIGDNGTVYICATGNAHSAWRAIMDHVSLYNRFVE